MLKAKWHQVQNCWCNANMQALAKPSKEQILFQEQTVEKFLVLYSVQCTAVSFQHLSQVPISWGTVDGVLESPCVSLLTLLSVCACYVCIYVSVCLYLYILGLQAVVCIHRLRSGLFDFEGNVAEVLCRSEKNGSCKYTNPALKPQAIFFFSINRHQSYLLCICLLVLPIIFDKKKIQIHWVVLFYTFTFLSNSTACVSH